MLDGAVTFDVDRYAEVPDDLARIARHLESAADLLLRSGDPVGARAAAAVDSLAGWVRREQRRAADRWERILAIPGFERFRDWDGSRGESVYDLDWVVHTDGPMHTFEEIAALVAMAEVDPALGLGADAADVDRAMAAIDAIDDPGVAAALLGLLGASGYRDLHRVLGESVEDPDDLEREELERLESGLGSLSTLFATASRATGTEALDPAVLDDLLPPLEVDLIEERGDEIDRLQTRFGQLDFGREVSERLAAAALGSASRAVVLLEGAQGPFIALTLAMPVVEALQEGVRSSEFVGTAMTSGLNVAAYIAETTPVTLGLLGGALLVQFLFAVADDPGRPPSRVLSPDADNPGGYDYPNRVNEAGVPAPPNGV